MQREQVECLTLENADFKTGQVFKIGGLSFLSVPVIAVIMLILATAILPPANPGSPFADPTSLVAMLFSIMTFIGPALFMWWKFHQRDRAFCAMFNDPKGQELLKEGQRLADQIKWLGETEEAITSELNNLNMASGSLGQGTPEFINPTYKTLTDECASLRTVAHKRARELHVKQDEYLCRIRADHNLPEPPSPRSPLDTALE